MQPAGRGTHVFPYHRIKVSVVAPSREIRARLEAVIDGAPSLTDRIIERLRAAGCDPSGVSVKVTYVSQSDSRWSDATFHVDFARLGPGAAVEPTAQLQPALDLTVTTGDGGEDRLLLYARTHRSWPMRRGPGQPQSPDPHQPRRLCGWLRDGQRKHLAAACPHRVPRQCRRVSGVRRWQRARHVCVAPQHDHRGAVGRARHPPAVGRRDRARRGAPAGEDHARPRRLVRRSSHRTPPLPVRWAARTSRRVCACAAAPTIGGVRVHRARHTPSVRRASRQPHARGCAWAASVAHTGASLGAGASPHHGPRLRVCRTPSHRRRVSASAPDLSWHYTSAGGLRVLGRHTSCAAASSAPPARLQGLRR